MKVRYAKPKDLIKLTDIYNHYILHSHATFDEKPQRPEERFTWFQIYRETGPYRLLLAEENAEILGCAYSSPYRRHPAFRETVETSIYLLPTVQRKGVGSTLYRELFSLLQGEKLHIALAGIALPNPASIALHKKFDFREVGIFHNYAIKHGTHISSLWMEKVLQTDS